jgi:hypothetical protein
MPGCDFSFVVGRACQRMICAVTVDLQKVPKVPCSLSAQKASHSGLEEPQARAARSDTSGLFSYDRPAFKSIGRLSGFDSALAFRKLITSSLARLQRPLLSLLLTATLTYHHRLPPSNASVSVSRLEYGDSSAKRKRH